MERKVIVAEVVNRIHDIENEQARDVKLIIEAQKRCLKRADELVDIQNELVRAANAVAIMSSTYTAMFEDSIVDADDLITLDDAFEEVDDDADYEEEEEEDDDLDEIPDYEEADYEEDEPDKA